MPQHPGKLVSMFDLWDLTPTKRPPRSRLYSLRPMGLGTSRVESLTSYLTRLAEAHTVSLRTLIKREVFPLLSESPKNFDLEKMYSLNGIRHDEQCVAVLEKLTCRTDLRGLTLLPLQSLISGCDILRSHRAWCPRCFEEWRSNTMPIYECLLWVLRPVMICPIHRVLLEQQCASCQKRSSVLSAYARPGFCQYCRHWLGTELPASAISNPGEATPDQLWVATTVAKLLTLDARQHRGTSGHLLRNLQRALSELADGNQRLLGRVMKTNISVVNRWFDGEGLPTLPIALRISQNLRLPLERLLREEISDTDPEWIQAKRTVMANHAAAIASSRKLTVRPQFLPHPSLRPSNRPSLRGATIKEQLSFKAAVKACLQANLEQDHPASVTETLQKIGYRHASRARIWFPELCDAIKQKREQRADTWRQELYAALEEVPLPTVAQVAARLGVRVKQLYFHRKCRPLYVALAPQTREHRRAARKAKLEAALRKALEQHPVSLITLAKRLHDSAYLLQIAFPDLCGQIRERYSVHKALQRQNLILLYATAVRQAVRETLDTGEYPSHSLVFSLISKRNPSLTNSTLTRVVLNAVRNNPGPSPQIS